MSVANEEIALLFKHNFHMVYLQSVSLVQAYKKIKPVFPLNESFFTDSEENKVLIDAFIFRFGKLQDMIGNKIFKGVLKLEKEEVGTMRDVLNKMEKLGILYDVKEWDALRDARNSVIHDYDDNFEKLAKDLNEMIRFTPSLIDVVKKVFNHVEANIGFDTNDDYAFAMSEVEIG